MLDPEISLGTAMMKGGHQLNSATEKREGPLVSGCVWVCWVFLKIVFCVSSSLLHSGTPLVLSYRPRKGLCTTCKTPSQRSLCIIKRLWKRDWCCSLSILRKVKGQSCPCLVHTESWKLGCAMSTSAFTTFSGLFCGNCIDKKNSPTRFLCSIGLVITGFNTVCHSWIYQSLIHIFFWLHCRFGKQRNHNQAF